MKELLGRSIQYIYISEDKSILAFIDWPDLYVYITEGDCCSTTWFEDIIDPLNMIREQIIGIEIMPEKENSINDHETLQDYGYKFKTSKGYTEVIYRNESNGYYGGSCEYLEGVTFENVIQNDLLHRRPIKVQLHKDKLEFITLNSVFNRDNK